MEKPMSRAKFKVIENKENNPRVGMVVHFCTDRAMRIPLVGENENYLDQIKEELSLELSEVAIY